MIALIDRVRLDRDTIGGIVTCVIKNTPVGLGEPVFDKLHVGAHNITMSFTTKVEGYEPRQITPVGYKAVSAMEKISILAWPSNR